MANGIVAAGSVAAELNHGADRQRRADAVRSEVQGAESSESRALRAGQSARCASAGQRRPSLARRRSVAGANRCAQVAQSVGASCAAVASALSRSRECDVAGTRRSTLGLIESCEVRSVSAASRAHAALCAAFLIRGASAPSSSL